MRKATYLRIQLLRKRDGPNCHLCGLPMWFRAPIVGGVMYKHPCAPSIDHIVPKSKRGPKGDLSNMKLAHKWCNHHRGSDPVEEFPAKMNRQSHLGVVVKELVRLCMVPKPRGLDEAAYAESFKL